MNKDLELKAMDMSPQVMETFKDLSAYAEVIKEVLWGFIMKGPNFDGSYAEEAERVRGYLDLAGLTHSIAIGVMEKGAYHEPYIRNVEGESRAKRVYKVISGSFTCYRGNQLRECVDDNSYVVVENMDIFSFTAGEEGCVFLIFDFPAFGSANAHDFNKVVVPAANNESLL